MKKRLRIGEFFIEKSIAGIAFVSLACIVLIFIFVFREASPIFRGAFRTAPAADTSINAKAKADAKEDAAVGQSGSYGDEADGKDSTGQSASYGDDSAESADSGAAAGAGVASTPPAPPPAAKALPAEPTAKKDKGKGLEWSRLFSLQWQPVSGNPQYGVLPLAVGSFKVALIAILIAGPIGILSALFTSTFAPRWAKELMKPIIEILAGIPSVVIGFFALVILATLVQDTFGLEYRLNAFLGGLAMSLAVIPIVYTLSDDALAAVPKSYTEGSLALGTTTWETNIKVVLPAAVPGIFAALLLGIGRAFGETMIVLMATGNAALLSARPFEPVRTISASIGAEMAEVVVGDSHYTVLFFLGALLFVFSFLLNAVAEIFVRDRLMRKFGGAT